MSSESQSASAVLMLRPANFAFNVQTASSNAFQHRPWPELQERELHSAALQEFDALARALQSAGVEVIVAEDSAQPVKPDAIFPNNWISFHADGTIVLYPMLAVNRRLERREELIEQVIRDGGFGVSRTVDLSAYEHSDKFLEGTGSLVLDRPGRLAYACLSPRTDLDVLGEFAQRLDYRLVTFDARGADGMAIYHTNVLMGLGAKFAVIALATITDHARRASVSSVLREGGRELIEISVAQMQQFAGNLLQLDSSKGAVTAISARAWSQLDAQQKRALERHGTVLTAHIPTIEQTGGGSVRCMLAEIHLPKRATAHVSSLRHA